MKKTNNNIFKNLMAVIGILLVSVSCNNWIDHDLNIDPDSPADVPMSLLLPAIQQSMGYNLVGNNTVRTNNIWMQHFDGTDRQSYTETRYQLTPADVNNVWSSIYTEMMMNSTIIINKARIEGAASPNFEGVGQVLLATSLGITTDLFGSIPYTEAFKGSENVLSPSYDSQESIYNTIFSLLDKALANLDNSANTIAVEGDVIYDGDLNKWKKAANSIKARHHLQLSGVNGNAAYTAALAAVSGGFTSNADDMLVPFEDKNRNPIYQFMEERTDIRMGATLIDMLAANDDPRLPFYAEEDSDGNFSGSTPGGQNDGASKPGSDIAAFDASTKLMTYSELKFIEAEARLALGQPGAQEAYEAAVAASVLRVTGAANQAWLDANINGIPVTLENIITQKYIDGVATNQPYADWRRTGFPALNIAEGAVIPNIPTRFPYAQSELDYNSENVPSVSISDKLWWDQ
ncbi:Starch-binding associating with outer membrane [Arenibacter nanhaiticus]|uniref:Starch-binding associating with outer membrane n=1 Tax=Arenibacter nanhaiticus TaxID=558155 RepID=A0A1M6EUW8_9FLAO|nr:SusD/RagB family nutrient-binding outer membrane lipoprotein [Arenibacter nanhaiticus]SHI89271.1 Starch-binding associating with outer membrane [Arenibacter nanhaiticus]